MIIKKQTKIYSSPTTKTVHVDEPKNSEYEINANIYIINDYDNYLKFDFSPVYKKKIYNTELLLITNNDNPGDIYLWLDWHLNVIKFNHIVLIDNNNTPFLYDTCKKFNNIEYIHKPGILSQAAIYTEYVNNSNAQWVLPIDDDEYLYISDKFDNNINYYLCHLQLNKLMYKYAFNWHMMFADHLKEHRECKNLFEDFPYEYVSTDEIRNNAFNVIKTIVNTDIKHYYPSENGTKNIIFMNDPRLWFDKPVPFFKKITIDNIGTFHNPISKIDDSYFFPAYNENDNYLYHGFFCIHKNDLISNNACIYHFRYKSKAEWYKKVQRFNFNSTDKTFLSDNYQNDKIDYVYNFINKKTVYNNILINTYANKTKN